jgi:hypothetical protein
VFEEVTGTRTDIEVRHPDVAPVALDKPGGGAVPYAVGRQPKANRS